MTREKALAELRWAITTIEVEHGPEVAKKFEEAIAALSSCACGVFLCPNCHGQKTVQKPPWVAGDQPTWLDSGTPIYPCPTCDAKGYIILPAEEEKA